MKYISWSISQDRLKHEWTLMRRSLSRFRIAFVLGAHALYFAVCLAAKYFGQARRFEHALWIGLLSLLIFSSLLLLLDLIYGRITPTKIPSYVIQNGGVTRYGDDGPREHFDWRKKRLLRIESDPLRSDFRTLVLSEARRNKWLREISRVRVPLPSPGEGVDELAIVEALHLAIHDCGMTWRTADDGTMVLMDEMLRANLVATKSV